MKNRIPRTVESRIKEKLFKEKTILLFGARQVGKTTLLESIVSKSKDQILWLNADEMSVRNDLTHPSLSRLKVLLGSHSILIIDEAQRIPEIGITLKLIHDNFKNIQVIATGSSSFELANQVNEPLTGRKYEYHLYPLSFEEITKKTNLLEEENHLENRLLFGAYPEIITHPEDSQERLSLLANSYLYKDLLILDQIKKNSLLQKLLQALALQLGNEVSIHELARLLGASHNTIEKYINLLEQAFIIFRLSALNKNVRNEIKKNKKIYFYDNGIRNAIIDNYNPINSRSDIGALWENYLVSERVKFLKHHGINRKFYFWRTTAQQEIDYIEEKNGEYSLYEFKWNKLAKVKFPQTFLNSYPVVSQKVITPKNYYEFLLPTEKT